MPDGSVQHMAIYSWDMPDGFVWDINSYVEVGYAGRLCLGHP